MSIRGGRAALDLTRLPPVTVQRGTDPALVRDELLWTIREQINDHPRSKQTAIGPSEIGNPCTRRIGYRLLDHPVFNPQTSWLSAIGTGMHTWAESAFGAENARIGTIRYLTEQTLFVGTIGGRPVFGHCDCYDRTTAGSIDHKVVGPTQLRNYKANGPGRQYRVQAHLYGRGWQLLGFPIDWVGVFFLPRNGELDQAHLWHEPYDEQVALSALARVEGIQLAVDALGADALVKLATAEAYCTRCPWFSANSADPRRGCPGDPAGMKQPDLFGDLLPASTAPSAASRTTYHP